MSTFYKCDKCKSSMNRSQSFYAVNVHFSKVNLSEQFNMSPRPSEETHYCVECFEVLCDEFGIDLKDRVKE